MSYTIFHNPRCSKSRQSLQLLHDAGVTPQVVEYLQAPPSAAELDGLCRKLGAEPPAIIRFKEQRAKDLGISASDARSRGEWLALIADNPILLERPIVVRGERAAIGRPPEQIAELLD